MLRTWQANIFIYLLPCNIDPGFCPGNVSGEYSKLVDGEKWTKLIFPPWLQVVSMRFLSTHKEMHVLDTRGIICIFMDLWTPVTCISGIEAFMMMIQSSLKKTPSPFALRHITAFSFLFLGRL